MIETAFILAGGFGTRLRSVLPDLPKPMASVAGRPFLELLFDYLLAQGVRVIVLCLHYRGKVIADHFGTTYRGARISYSVEEKPLGTGGALLNSLRAHQPDRPFAVLNGDTYFPIDLSVLEQMVGDVSWTIAAFEASDPGRFGELRLGKAGGVLQILEPNASPNRPSSQIFFANSGVWVGNPEKILLSKLPEIRNFSRESYLAMNLNLGSQTARAHLFHSTFVDIGLPQDLLDLHNHLKSGQ